MHTLSVQEIRQVYEDRCSRLNLLREQRADKIEQIEKKEQLIEDYTKAKWVLTQALLLTEQRFTAYLESMVNFVLGSVYTEDLKFKVTFEMDRGKPSCDLMVQDGDNPPYYPKDETGGGILDVISFALRIILWSLKDPRPRPVLLLDEPMKNIGKGVLLKRIVDVMKKISQDLDIQLIINTHITELAEMTDAAWEVKKTGNLKPCEVIALQQEKEETFPVRDWEM